MENTKWLETLWVGVTRYIHEEINQSNGHYYAEWNENHYFYSINLTIIFRNYV